MFPSFPSPILFRSHWARESGGWRALARSKGRGGEPADLMLSVKITVTDSEEFCPRYDLHSSNLDSFEHPKMHEAVQDARAS